MGDEYKSEMTQRAKGFNRVCCASKSLEPKLYCEGVWLVLLHSASPHWFAHVQFYTVPGLEFKQVFWAGL